MQVRDQSGDRVLLVLVYSDAAAALLERDRALIRDDYPVNGNPHVVTGYGPGVWSDNVALVQSTQSQLNRMSGREANRDMRTSVGATPPVLSAEPPNTGVDLDFIEALNSSVVNL
jgi:hypothetical protein